MSFQKTIVLALILLACLGYIFWIELPHLRETSKKDYALRDLVPEEIQLIEIAKADGSFELKNGDVKVVSIEEKEKRSSIGIPTEAFKSWQLASISGSELDSTLMNSLVTSLRDLKLDSVIPTEDLEEDLSVYGLKEPSLVLRVKSLSQQKEFQLGKLSSYLNKRYLKMGDGKDIYLIADTLFTAANKSADDFRDKTPVDFTDAELKRITLHNNKSNFKFEVDPEKRWRIIEPINALASGVAISEMSRTLRNLRVKDFINDTTKLSDYSLDKPKLKVVVEFTEGSKRTPLELFIDSKKINNNDKEEIQAYLYTTGAPSIYSLTTDPIDLIIKPLDAYREKTLFKFATDKAVKVTAEGESVLKLARSDGEQWSVNDKEGDQVFVDQWLANLSQLEAKAFPSESKNFGFDKPKFKVVVELEGGSVDTRSVDTKSVTNTLIVGEVTSIDKENKGYFAYVNDPKEVFIISEDSFMKITLKEEALIKATPVATPIAQSSTASQVVQGQPTP